MKKSQLIKSDLTKKIYKSSNDDQLIIEFLDINPFKKSKKKKITSRGECNNGTSALILEILESYHVPTYFLQKSGVKEMIVKNYVRIPIKIIIRNITAGNLCKKYNIPEGKILDYPIIEYYLKNEKLNDPFVNEYYIYALNYANPEEMKTIVRMSSKINAILKSFFKRRNLNLVDIKLEFGRIKGKTVVCDEISPETCTIWDIQTDEKYDLETMTNNPDSADQIYKTIIEKMKIKN